MDPKVPHVEGYKEFCETVANLEKKKTPLFILFSGAVNSEGINWCPDCEEAEPIITEALADLPEDAQFLHVSVGPREEWKNPCNPFRKDPKLKLTAVPTLLLWGQPKRLVESECKKIDLVKMLFEDD